MSRTTRRIPGHIAVCPHTNCWMAHVRDGKWQWCHNYNEWCWDDHVYLERGHAQPENLRWPRYDGWWGFKDDTGDSPRSHKWMKRYTSKYRRRRARREIQQQLEE